MPPKRKHAEPDASPAKDSKKPKETKEEKKKRIEAQKLRAKKWAEERKARAAAKTKVSTDASPKKDSSMGNGTEKTKTVKRGRKSTGGKETSGSTAVKTPQKKKPVVESSIDKSGGASDRVTRDEKDDMDHVIHSEEEDSKPRVKRRKLTTDVEETEHENKPQPPAKVIQVQQEEMSRTTRQHFMSPENRTNGRVSVPVVQNFMSPEAGASFSNSGHNFVYVPVNVASLQAVSGNLPIPKSEPIQKSIPNRAFVPTDESVASRIPEVNREPVGRVEEKVNEPVTLKHSVEVENEEESEEQDDSIPKRSITMTSLFSTFIRNFVKCTVVTSTVSLFLFVVTSLLTSRENANVQVTEKDVAKSSTHTTPCFYNRGFGGENELMDLPCMNPVDCPKFGRCEGGKLIDCILEDIEWENDFYVPSQLGDRCVLSPSAEEAMNQLHDILVELSVEYVCRSNIGLGPTCRVPFDDVVANGSISFDSIHVSKIANITEDRMNSLLRHIDNDEVIQFEGVNDKKGKLVHYVGLSEKYVTKMLPVPFACYLRILSWDFIRIFATMIYGGLKMLLSLILSITVTNPIPTFFVGGAMYSLFWITHRRSKVARLRKESSKIQNMAYDKLIMDCNEGEGYASLHLRDEIAHELYPEQCSDRKHFISVVWPRVVALVRSDNRVIKTRKTIGGKSLEWWEWAADSSRKSRRSLAANSIVANEGENATKRTKVE